ncbi:MAG TPA: glycoside hydrolase family 2 TIM barrel-domain containing protein [Lacipirellulaceae bacterium]|jgi:hypothetical protein|nr:glycoside hydrolase family 2 TIM barrel-domain containing protein [Lacipirellulaceae bacterium]
MAVGRILLISLAFLMAIGSGEARAWRPAAGPLKTRWTNDVSPKNVLPEYPRPQMVRDEWTNLNGLWQYAILAKTGSAPPIKWDGEILVPFAIESALSGVKKPVEPDEQLWYRRTFKSPTLPKNGRLLIHFGAVDWESWVYVNGKLLSDHPGGYTPFTIDITDALRSGENEVMVRVEDPTDTGNQPRGKQVLKPHGIFYTAVTGIWQTVWLEPVPENYIKSVRVIPDVDRKQVEIRTTSSHGAKIRVTALDGEVEVGRVEGLAGGDKLAVPITNAKLWSPSDPHLYNLRIELMDGQKVIDSVTSYFGMRKIEVKKDAEGINRLWLNDQVLFQFGPLDQGWWPDGLYTAPTDAALKYDIEMTKRFGMNLIRKHVKVEPARWYYWCDNLGMLVWQDMPSGDVQKTDQSKKWFEIELEGMIEGLRSFPSIVMWVPFNEGWGQHDTEQVVKLVQEIDPTRPVNEASGWNNEGFGDVTDMHNYPGPGMRDSEEKRVSVLGEFGGLGMPIKGHTWQSEKNWGYVSYNNADELTDAYVNLLTMMRPLIGQGLSAAVYTQTTDVEIEVNGLMTYDREQVKMNESRMREAANKLFEPPPKMAVLMPTSEAKPQTWHYIMRKPESSWFQPDFDDSSWRTGPGGFGTEGTPRAVVRSEWDTPDIWLRRTFKVESLPEAGQLMLTAHHDEDAEIYINGELVKTLPGVTRHYAPTILNADARKALHVGENTMAVHCHQTTGGQYIDVGLADVVDRDSTAP